MDKYMEKPIKGIFFVLFMVLLLTGCVSPQTQDAIKSNVASLAVTEAAITGPAYSTTGDVERAADIKEQIDLFLNSDTPYTEEDIEFKMFKYDSWKGEIELGIISAPEDPIGKTVEYQGVLLGYIEADDGIMILVGFQDKQGNRFVSPLKIYDVLNNIQTTQDSVLGFRYVSSPINLHADWSHITTYSDRGAVLTFLDERVGTVLGFQTSLREPPEYSDELKKQLIQNGIADPETYFKQLREINMKTFQITKDLVLSIWCPAPENLGVTISQSVLASYGPPSSEPINIITYEDIVDLRVSESAFPKADIVLSQK